MRVTSQEANKILKQVQEEIVSEMVKENNNCEFSAATIEDKEELRPSYDFRETQSKLAILEEKVRKIKHAINVFNCSTEVVDGMTIDQALVFLPQLTQKKNKLTKMRHKKERTQYPPNGGIINYGYINYNPKDVEEEYNYTCDMLARIQNELNKVNITIKFDIPD